MESMRRIFLCVFLLGAQLLVQAQDSRRPAATAPAFEASAGYAYMIMSQPFSTRVELVGVNGEAVVQFSPRWGAAVDLTYAHVGHILRTPRNENVLSALVGPVFYPIQRERTSVFVHALGGMAWVDSAVPISSTSYFSGYETRFSYALGGGAEYTVTGPFAVKVGADYQRTTFVNQGLGLQNQRNFRLTAGIAYRFGGR